MSRPKLAKNRYGVDVAYFEKELTKLSLSLPDRTPEELYRYFIALANVAFTGEKKTKTPHWICIAVRLPKESTSMEIHRVLVQTRDDVLNGSWHVGWYHGGLLEEWRIEGSPNRQDVLFWMEVPV